MLFYTSLYSDIVIIRYTTKVFPHKTVPNIEEKCYFYIIHLYFVRESKMAQITLEEEEYIISSDDAACNDELFSRKGSLYLTNTRLFFLDTSTWRKRKNCSIDLEDIDLLEPQNNGFMIDTENGKHFFRGTGATRIYERLKIRREALSIGAVHTPDTGTELREIIYLQGDINLINNNFSTPAQLFFTSKELRITTNTSWFRRSTTIKTNLDNIASFHFTLRSKTLSIHLHDRIEHIVFSGTLAPSLYLSLMSHQDGGVAEKWNSMEAGYTRGLLKVKGLLSITKKRVAFCPTESIDSITQSKELEIPIKDIYKIERKGWPEKSITLFFSDKEVMFTTRNTEKDFPFFRQAITEHSPTPPWKVQTRSELKNANKEWGATLKPNAEKILLICWAAHKINNDLFHTGWLMLSNLQVRFLNKDKTLKWSAPVLQIQKSLEQYSGIRIHYKNKEFEFLCFGGSKFSKAFWSKIKTLKPPPELQEARSGQEMHKILGSSPISLVFFNKILVHRLSRIFVRKSTKSLTIQCEKISYSELKIGDLIELEIPKIIGRFRFFTKIQSINLSSPNASGGYEITVSHPDNIYVYNQRKAFRIPFEQESTVSIHRTHDTNKHLLYEDVPQERVIEGDIFDVSFGGCGIMFEEDLNDSDPQTMLLRFSCNLYNEKIQLQGLVRHIVFKPNIQKWAHGIEFINLPDKTEQKIFEHVLSLERDMLQREQEEE